MKKFTMDFAEPVSRIPSAMIEPKIIVQPMPVKVPPKPLVNRPIIFSGAYPINKPAINPETNNDKTGCTLSLTIKKTKIITETAIAIRNCDIK